MKLLIVESPAKCKKIQGFLGSGWRVQATMGHIRALKEELEAIGFRTTWTPTYESISTKRDAIANLRKAASGAEVYLGSDDDREGEAIAWHTCNILGLDPATTPRVVFHEITESALKAAVANPTRIDMNKFNAQQARTMLDMLIGFTLSPCLWRGVGFKPGLSAGRCQTPALRIIYDRDREIEAHSASNTWRISAISEDCIEDSTLTWTATGDNFPTEAAANDVLKQLTPEPRTLTVTGRQERIAVSKPPAPFITSSLQQEASSRLGMKPKDTMRAAQTLYEGGHITYMRTDNAILSQEAIEAASVVVRERFGEEFLASVTAATEGAPKKKVTKKKASTDKPDVQAQAAHEGIRPTHMEVNELPDATAAEKRLYELIWRRTLQSVMAPEQRDVVKLTAVPTVKPSLLTMVTEWEQTRFAGWRALDNEKKSPEELETEAAIFEARADLGENTLLDWQTFTAMEHRSAPPSRYTEASLIRELESRGIGRPSTYAALVETVLDREYVEKATTKAEPVKLGVITLTAGQKAPKASTRTEKMGGEKDKLRATALGRTVMEWLLSNFGDMLEYDFTAAMESQLDEVAKGSRQWKTVLTDTWGRYEARYDQVMSAPKSSEGGSGPNSPTRSANKVEFGDGYKMVVSKKGPLFVLEREGEKTRFASVPANISLQTATRQDAEAAFASATKATEGEELGELDGQAVVRRKGPYGHYAVWGIHRVNCTEADTLDTISARLQQKAAPPAEGAVDHQVGEYKIKRGPYGLYMFKVTAPGAKTKPTFVSIPDTTPWHTLTPEGAGALYKHCLTAKKEATAAKKMAPRSKKGE
jgi:DNA topoisomerase-1